MNHISVYKSESMLTSKSVSIDANAQEIHHRIMLHAINQKTIDINKLVHENRIFCSSFLWKNAMISGIHKKTSGKTRIYNNDSEYVRLSKSMLYNSI